MVPVGQGLMGKRKKSKRACVVRPRQLSGEGKKGHHSDFISDAPFYLAHDRISLSHTDVRTASACALDIDSLTLVWRRFRFLNRIEQRPSLAAEQEGPLLQAFDIQSRNRG